jgi:hypothetical protein
MDIDAAVDGNAASSSTSSIVSLLAFRFAGKGAFRPCSLECKKQMGSREGREGAKAPCLPCLSAEADGKIVPAGAGERQDGTQREVPSRLRAFA